MINTLGVWWASLCCAFALASAGVAAAAAEKPIKKDEARKLIAAVSIFDLNKQAVTIREISPPAAAAAAAAVSTVVAGVKLGFRFERDEAGAWRVVEVRTGDRQWESFELLARALGGESVSPARAELDAFAAELDALAKAKNKTPNDARQNPADGTDQRSQPPQELKRGALSVKNPADALAPTGSMAVVELEVETFVDFVRDARSRWQVSRVRFGEGGGGRSFEAFDGFERALDREKLALARADLATLAAALEAYRRSRGFYVVAASVADLVDHLNPRYTSTFIRFDPWHRPYEYEGVRERYTLRSPGADGKARTADDVTVEK